MEKTIYDLKLNERIDVNGNKMTATRVPGGWVYAREEPQVDMLSCCFVPFSKEFKKRKGLIGWIKSMIKK